MAIMQISSDNPTFSYVIKKNPASGMSMKPLRKGHLFGWFSDSQHYNLYFKDADNEVSYPQRNQDHFEYLNASRFNSPMIPLNFMSEMLDSALKTESETDTNGYINTVFINAIHVKNRRFLNYFQTHFKDYDLDYQETAYKNYQLTIRTTQSLHKLLNFSSVLCLFLTLIENIYLDVFSHDLIRKYIKMINVIEAPFFIRYLFSRNMLTNKKNFLAFKSELEQCSLYDINLSFGSTSFQRLDWMTSFLPFSRPIIDIGCGEGAYAIPFSGKIKPSPYYAIDIDEEVRKTLAFTLKKKDIDNVSIYDSLDAYLTEPSSEPADVLLTEVVEHMELTDASAFVTAILTKVNFHQLILTTPNADFNQYYKITDMRHDDHKWEISSVDFRQWIVSLTKEDYHVHFYDIGDNVNGIATTQGVIITRKDV